MEYPYADIYSCIVLAGLEETPKINSEGELVYAEVPTRKGKMEHYKTDGNCFFLFSPNHHDYTPFWPHQCYDHLFYILRSWQLNGNLIAAEGVVSRGIQQELFGRTMINIVESIIQSPGFYSFKIERVWEQTVTASRTLERFIETARAIDGTNIQLSTKRI